MTIRGRAAIITAYDPYSFKGGIETYLLQLVDLLRLHGIQSDLYHTGREESCHGFHNDYLGKLYLAGQRVLKGDQIYDFVLANAFYGLGYFPPAVKTYNVFHLTHMAFAEAIRDISITKYLELKLLWGRLCEGVSTFNRAVIAVSESVKDELKEHYEVSDAVVVPNFVDTDLFVKTDKAWSRKKWGIPEDVFTGLYVGRWDAFKGSDILEQVMRRAPHVHWTVVLGTGNYRHLMPALDNLTVYEEIEHAVIRELYSSADFLLFPSRYEGYGYVMVEAMACELPVIATNVGIARTILKREPFSQLRLPEPSGGREEIVLSALEKIEYVRSHQEWANVVAKEGRRLMEEEYHVGIWREDMARVLELA